ncbi:hypothetical protein ACWGH3_18800 [Streptomyces sp. NPDC054884]|uniref:hypothetical protein n=1 Tax=Streptomyces sp. ME08-AFT2 TaxID=3028683 RepID=UPI0029B2948F|nr:hypothetical protein [Streptomyces sp. ME08-AFT2]MDX3315122.1 hypothetical protein [Streptomyces sp. ME08-AFT2]
MVTQADWETAVLRLLEDLYTFVATGPRTHSGWQSDVLAVMNREVGDPRAWNTLDWDEDRDEEEAADGPSYPFLPLSREVLTERLHLITSETAVQLLAAMTYDWGPVESDGDEAQVLADARTLLGRYGDAPTCYSNITDGRMSSSPDLSKGVTGWTPLTRYDGDFGFVVVSSEEIGVFWSFNPA